MRKQIVGKLGDGGPHVVVLQLLDKVFVSSSSMRSLRSSWGSSSQAAFQALPNLLPIEPSCPGDRDRRLIISQRGPPMRRGSLLRRASVD